MMKKREMTIVRQSLVVRLTHFLCPVKRANLRANRSSTTLHTILIIIIIVFIFEYVRRVLIFTSERHERFETVRDDCNKRRCSLDRVSIRANKRVRVGIGVRANLRFYFVDSGFDVVQELAHRTDQMTLQVHQIAKMRSGGEDVGRGEGGTMADEQQSERGLCEASHFG
jgi:hypothetical protein